LLALALGDISVGTTMARDISVALSVLRLKHLAS
jgi:predicted phosphoribosyltransferase